MQTSRLRSARPQWPHLPCGRCCSGLHRQLLSNSPLALHLRSAAGQGRRAASVSAKAPPGHQQDLWERAAAAAGRLAGCGWTGPATQLASQSTSAQSSQLVPSPHKRCPLQTTSNQPGRRTCSSCCSSTVSPRARSRSSSLRRSTCNAQTPEGTNQLRHYMPLDANGLHHTMYMHAVPTPVGTLWQHTAPPSRRQEAQRGSCRRWCVCAAGRSHRARAGAWHGSVQA